MGDSYEQHYGLRGRAFEPRGGPPSAILRPDEVEPYVVARLRAVGWEGTPMLDLGLAPLLHEATGGSPAAIDRAMTALLDEAAHRDHRMIDGDGLAAWLERDGGVEHGSDADFAVSDPDPEFEPAPGDVAHNLAAAQLDAIEGAFAEHDRKLSRLRRELADLRAGSTAATPLRVDERLDALEARLDRQEAALRHVLDRLIVFFEDGRTG